MWLPFIVKLQALPRLKEINKKLKIAALTCAGFAGVNLLLYAALIAPAAARFTAAETRYAELRQRHAEAVLFQKQKSAFAGIQAGMPAQKDMPLLVKGLLQTARRLNLSVASVKYDIPRRVNGEPAMLAFSLPVEGKYPDIKRFIYEVETSDQLVGIQAMKLTSEKGRVKMEMKLITYVKG
jgi:Tfp pilus assembly protein PilO